MIKKTKKVMMSACVLMFSLTMMNTQLAVQAQAAEPAAAVENEGNTAIAPLSDRIDWRYKIVDGVMYKRLYNYGMGEWVGDWIRCV